MSFKSSNTPLFVLVFMALFIGMLALLGAAGPVSAEFGPTTDADAPIHAQPTSCETIHIMALGDSITQGNPQNISYRRDLAFLLADNGYQADFVGSHSNYFWDPPVAPDYDIDHEGHWAWKADEIIDGRDYNNGSGSGSLSQWLTGYTPDVALVHLGTNDMFSGDSVSSTVTELETIIGTIRSDNPSVIILLAKLIPTNNYDNNQRIIALNNEMDGIAQRNSTFQSPIVVVDQFSNFDPATDTYDGIHANASGRQKMAQKWFEGIQTVIDPCPSGQQCQRILQNGDFEFGPSSWNSHAGHQRPLICDLISCENLPVQPLGAWTTWLGGVENDSSYIFQPVVIPANRSVSVTMRIRVDARNCGDTAALYWYTASQGATPIVSAEMCPNLPTGWFSQTLNLSSYAGERGFLVFGMETEPFSTSAIFLDNISVRACVH
jgi:hypothetical protein